MDRYFEPLDELERLARNKPSPKISPELPRITDGTLAAIVQEQPKRIIQQAPTGLLECKDYPEYAKMADIVLREELIPAYNRMGNMLQKSWSITGKAMTYGSAASYTFFTSTNGKFHTDFILPYAKDIIGEKGKVFAPDSNIGFMRSWYQERDIDAIINREKLLMQKFPSYKPEWDLKLLQQFKSAGAAGKPADLQTPAEKEKGGDSGGFQVIHAFQVGVGAEFYSFSPQFEDGKPLRTKLNQDPRGNMPLDWLYCNIDHSNPLGRGVVELSGGVQNLIDQQMQMFQFITTMLMAPPMQVWGNPKRHTLKYMPNAIWKMGNSQNNMVKPLDINNQAIQNFPNNYGLLKSQIFNLNSAQDHSVAAESGNPSQSKTQAGVKASEARLGVSDNYLRKQFESWFQDQSETSVNVYFSEMRGQRFLTLEKDDIKEIAKTEAAQFLTQGGKLRIPFTKIKDVSFRFHVDASSSEIKEDVENAEKLAQSLELIQKSQDPQVRAAEVKVTKLLLQEIGAEGTDDLFPEEELDVNGQPVAPQQTGPDPAQLQEMVAQMIQEAMQAQKAQGEDPMLQLIKALGMKFNDLPEGARQLVLEHTGFNTGEPTPQDRKDDIETLDAINRADPKDDMQPGAQKPGGANKQNPMSPAMSPQQPQQEPGLDDDETEFAKALFNRGFEENDVEQAIVMKRQGMPVPQIIQTIGAKYVQQN